MSTTFAQRWKWGAFMAVVFLAAGIFALVKQCESSQPDSRRWLVGPKSPGEQIVPLPAVNDTASD